MKVALISDIHGSAIALDAVLADIARQDVDQIVCLGDVLALGPQPRQVLDRLRALDCLCVMGNHDEEFAYPALMPPPDNWPGKVIAWCAALLSEDDRAYLATFRPSFEIPLEGGKKMFCCHATPRDNQAFLLATTPDDDVEAMLAGYWGYDVIAFGHTHTQLLRLYRKSMLVSVGSVGYPIARPWSGRGEDVRTYFWAEYALVRSEGERIGVEFRRLPLDMAAVKAAVQSSDMPNLETWFSMWLET
ncbi:MAG: metallophosphoesterase family protein [Chloroflexota bacterium]